MEDATWCRIQPGRARLGQSGIRSNVSDLEHVQLQGAISLAHVITHAHTLVCYINWGAKSDCIALTIGSRQLQ